MKKLIIIFFVAALTACGTNNAGNETMDKQSKSLVLYYSQTGATGKVAELIASSIGADIERFDVEEPYNGDFQQTVERGNAERTSGVYPKIAPLTSDISQYDVIFLGYPIWYGVAAIPVFSLIESQKFDGKTIVPFCTFGSGGLETSISNLKEIIPNVDIRDGYGVRNARVSAATAEVEQFLIASGFKEGEVKILPDFSEVRDFTPEEGEIFNAACGSYEMPLGTPSAVRTRSIDGGTEYCFTVNPGAGESYIYVIDIEGRTPEFTKVVRQ